MFLKCNSRFKNGKDHRYWSIVENKRCAEGKVVQRAVLQSPRLSDREVENFSAMANLSEDVLRLIARNRIFIGNPIVVRNLLNNPKTPLEISLHFLPNANAQDLKALTLNRNIPDTLRTMAARLHRQRALQRA